MTWGCDLDAFLQERRQQAPAAGDTVDEKAETIGSFQGGAVGASSAPAGRAESERATRLNGAQWTPPRPRQGGPKARHEVRLKGVRWTGAANELRDWGRPPVTVRGRTRGQSQRLEGEQSAE